MSSGVRYYDRLFKVVVIGIANVGKTSLTRVFCGEEFKVTELATIQRELFTTYFKKEKMSIKIDIYDTAGSERYALLTKSYLRAASGIVLVYDANNPKSLGQSVEIYKQVIDEDPEFTPSVILVGGKSDLGVRVSKSEIDSIGDSVKYFNHVITSAKTGENVECIFEMLIDNMLENELALMPRSRSYGRLGLTGDSETSLRGDRKNRKKGGCCVIL
ncbi:MAG: hypothetical protein Hyperionvirus9_65 [Hyperionvirus sp.]|uniref:Uncharacterized protein n=1 Tax=Hyperionvirus sp. TaxID=2487770 RepID=A0A3G5A8R9_9VIRU|nr:MAG: hypothetical protein Hyperionvirus9_65 [Hyperionvirus sp.]